MPAGTSYTVKEGMLFSEITKAPKEEGDFYEVTVKNQFLHAVHPVGWIKKLQIIVDEKEIEEEDIYFVLRGQWFHAPKMHSITENFWKLSEPAKICFRLKDKLTAGNHNVKCIFNASMLEDPRILDKKGLWPLRVEFVEGILTYKGEMNDEEQ